MLCIICKMRPADPFREDGICAEDGWFWDYWNGLSDEEKEIEAESPVPFALRGPVQ